MRGQMMNEQLTITMLMQHGKSVNSEAEIVSVVHDNPRHRYTLGECFDRAAQLANALQGLGLKTVSYTHLTLPTILLV